MSTPRFTAEFKEEAVRQVVERGYRVPDVAARLGVSAKWVKVVCTQIEWGELVLPVRMCGAYRFRLPCDER